MRRIAFFAVLILIVLRPVYGDSPVAMKTKPVTISLFKNGLGFVTRQGGLPKEPATVVFEALPEVIHGTFWVSSEGNNFRNLIAHQEQISETVPATNLMELLQANVGQDVEIVMGPEQTLAGKILALPDRPLDPSAQARVSGYTPLTSEQGSVLLLQTDYGIVALNKQSVQQIRTGQTMQTDFNRNRLDTILQMQTTGSGGQLNLHYLTRGITWAPSSQIDITDPKTARITAKAEILNELEDLEGVSVDFITGFPNFQFVDVIDPMALRGDLSGFLNSLVQRGRDVSYRADSTMQQVAFNVASRAGEAIPGYSVAAPVEGQTAEELFFYQQKDVSLKKGQRGYYPLYKIEVPYEHVYEWKIPNTLNQNPQQWASAQQLPQQSEVVWHSLRLSNTGGIPWTTSPAMILQDGKILGQDLIYYTSPGSKTLVRITQAVDIQAEQAEFETDRQRGVTKFYGYNYDLVTVRGRLKASNYKSKEVLLTISKELSGEVLKSVPEARVEQTARGLKQVNPQNVLTWEIPVAARDKIEIEYEYQVYVRD